MDRKYNQGPASDVHGTLKLLPVTISRQQLLRTSVTGIVFGRVKRRTSNIENCFSGHITIRDIDIKTSDSDKMGAEEVIAAKLDDNHETWAMSKHVFSDVSDTSPVVFIYLLKECYVYGTCKATKKFRVLQQQVYEMLKNAPQPGPATFVVQCLYILPVLESYSEGFSHLIISALRRILKAGTTSHDSLKSRDLAARLFLDIVGGTVNHDERILMKVVEVFDVKFVNIERAIDRDETKSSGNDNQAEIFIEQYISELVKSQSYMTAVTLIEQFSTHQFGESFLHTLIQEKQFKAAEKWVTYMGKSMSCVLIQEYLDTNKLKDAYEIIKINNLQEDFPDVKHRCKESSLKKLAEKGVWDVAEDKARSNKQLLEYLVYLAMEAGYSEKVDELCTRYSLEGFAKANEPQVSFAPNHYLDLNEMLVEPVVWVDEVYGLQNATTHIEGSKVVGMDCEWKPNYVKGSIPNKVSIMQIASEKKVFIFDLIKLHEDVPDTLDNCLARILHSPGILKLGYNFQCDMKQLADSYGDLKCFKHYEMLLDIQNIFNESCGGLSGLAKKILGTGLNKTRRNSNWEQRPLSPYQLEYAALDAVVLIHIFSRLRSRSQPTDATEEHVQIEWKSHIESKIGNPKRTKKELQIKQGKDDTYGLPSESR